MTIRRASRTLVYGVLSLSAVSVISRILRAVTTIIVARDLGSEGYGLWGLTLAAIGLFALFGSIPGIGSAVIRYVSQYDAEGKPDAVRRVAIVGLQAKTVLSLIVGSAIFALAPYIAKNLMNNSELINLIRISVAYYIAVEIGFVTSVLKGLKKFHLVAIFVTIERFLFFLFITFALLAGLGLMGVIVGNAAAYVTLAVITVIVIFTKYIPKTANINNTHEYREPSEASKIGLLKKMVSYGSPAALGGIIKNFYDDFIIIYLGIYTSATFVGFFGAARSAMNFLFVTTMSFVTSVLFPLATEMHSKDQIEELRRFLALISKYLLFFTCYLAAFTWIFSSELVTIIYSAEFEISAQFLQILIFIPIAGVWPSLAGNLLLGAGQSKTTLKLNAVYVISGTVLAMLIVPAYGVLGLCVLLVLLETSVALPLHIFYAQKIVGNFLDIKAYAKGALALLPCIATVGLAKSLLSFNSVDSLLSLIILGVLFVANLLLSIILLALAGAVKKSEIHALNEILSSSPVSTLLKPIIFLLKNLAKITRA